MELRGLGLGFGHAGTRAAHDGGETPREFTDAVGLVQEHGFARISSLPTLRAETPARR